MNGSVFQRPFLAPGSMVWHGFLWLVHHCQLALRRGGTLVLTCSLYLIGIPQISEHDSSKCPYGYNIHAQTSCFQGRKIKTLVRNKEGFPGGSVVKNLPANAGDVGSILGLGRSPGKGNDSPLHYYCLGNPMDRGTCQATVHGVAKESDMTEWLNNRNKSTWLMFTSDRLMGQEHRKDTEFSPETLSLTNCSMGVTEWECGGLSVAEEKIPALPPEALTVRHAIWCSLSELVLSVFIHKMGIIPASQVCCKN